MELLKQTDLAIAIQDSREATAVLQLVEAAIPVLAPAHLARAAALAVQVQAFPLQLAAQALSEEAVTI